MNSHKTIIRPSIRARVRNPYALLTTPPQIPGVIPTICPAGLAKPGTRLGSPR